MTYSTLHTLLHELTGALQRAQCWEALPPSDDALASQQPFALDKLTPTQWLQWIFIPRMTALIEARAQLPRNFAITPYLEEALKEEAALPHICRPIYAIEQLLADSERKQ